MKQVLCLAVSVYVLVCVYVCLCAENLKNIDQKLMQPAKDVHHRLRGSASTVLTATAWR